MPEAQTYRPAFFCSEEIAGDARLRADVANACARATGECARPSTANLSVENWEARPETLLYLLLKEGRFRRGQGEFGVLYRDDAIVALSGAYLHESDAGTAIGGVRSWVEKAARRNFLLARFLLPRQREWARERGCAKLWLTFNEHNRAMAMRKRGDPARRTALLLGQRDDDFYARFRLLAERVVIKATPQYVWEERLS